MASQPSDGSTDTAAKKRGLFGRKKPDGAAKKPGRIKQIYDVYQMTRRADPRVTWWLLLVFLGTIALGVVVGILVGHPLYVPLVAIPVGLLGAMFLLSRRAEKAAYSQIEGKPGAAGAALSSLRRGWIVQEQPVAIDPRHQDLVFRAVGRPGVVLVTEGPSARVKRLVEQERRRVARIVPNVDIHVFEVGAGAGQLALQKVPKKIMKLRPKLTKTEALAVDRRLSSLASGKPPIPKGVDPFRMRPDHKAMRGR